MVERVWDFSHTVHALKLWVATEWPSVKDARKVVVHGGGWGSEDGDRQLAESMQLGRLWGAEQGVAEVHIRKGECPTGDSLELVAGRVRRGSAPPTLAVPTRGGWRRSAGEGTADVAR
jgi:hypothetical protein